MSLFWRKRIKIRDSSATAFRFALPRRGRCPQFAVRRPLFACRNGNGHCALADRLRESARMTNRFRQSAAILASIGRHVIGHGRGAVLISCLVAAGSARAEDDWATTRESFLCKSSTEVREIKTYSNSSDTDHAAARGCRVDYIKNGTTQTIWSSRSSRSFCD